MFYHLYIYIYVMGLEPEVISTLRLVSYLQEKVLVWGGIFS